MEKPEVERAAPEASEVDLDLARQLFDGDETMLRLAARVFLEEGRDQLDAVAVALRDGDAARLHDAAHRLKGSVAMFAAGRATELADRLQRTGGGDLAEAGVLLAELEERFPRLMAELGALVRSPAEEPVSSEGRAAGGGFG